MASDTTIGMVTTVAKSSPSSGPVAWIASAWRNRLLIYRLSKREIEARYRGSVLGLVWSLVVPIALLAVYTFVFSVVFQARWDASIEHRGHFALVLFSGLILFNIFAECLNRAPTLMLQHVSYIKKVVFPLEILPWVVLIAAMFNAAISFLVLGLGYLMFFGVPPWTALLVPFLILPHLALTLGISLFLASVGVFIRDLQHIIGVLLMVLMFLTPIFFPVSAIPEGFRPFIQWSPLSIAVEGMRDLIFWARLPSATIWAIYTAVCWLAVWLGYVWFMKTKKGFADVI